MRLVFFGTGKFGVPALKKLFKSGHEIIAVVTRPDRPKGRGWNVQPTSVKAVVEQVSPGMNILQPENMTDSTFVETLRTGDPEVFVVIDYGQKLTEEVLGIPSRCCINLHPSLLPKYRGASPVNWAIFNGEQETGNTVIEMTERMDAGNIVLQEKVHIEENEDAVSLSQRLSETGAKLVLQALTIINDNSYETTEQDESVFSRAPKLEKKHGIINWEASVQEIMRQIKAMQPWPGAFTYLDGKMLKIIDAIPADRTQGDETPGTVCDPDKFVISTGGGMLQVKLLQLEGKKVMPAEVFLKGRRIVKGTILGS